MTIEDFPTTNKQARREELLEKLKHGLRDTLEALEEIEANADLWSEN